MNFSQSIKNQSKDRIEKLFYWKSKIEALKASCVLLFFLILFFFSKFFEEILKNSHLIFLHLILLFSSYCVCYWIFNLQLEKYSYSRRLSKLKWKTKSVVKNKSTYFLIDFFPKNIFDFLLFARLIRINIQKNEIK